MLNPLPPLLCLLSILLLPPHSQAASPEPPIIPVGLDAYRMWDRWPCQRIGCRAYMRSTYDRNGGNEGADASHFLFQLARRLQRHPRRRRPRHPLLRPLQPLARQPLALRRRRHRPRRPGNHHGRSKASQRRLHVPPCRSLSRPARLDLVHHQGRRPVLGAHPLRILVPHGLRAHPLRHRLLHLPPVRAAARSSRSPITAWDDQSRRRHRTSSTSSAAPASDLRSAGRLARIRQASSPVAHARRATLPPAQRSSLDPINRGPRHDPRPRVLGPQVRRRRSGQGPPPHHLGRPPPAVRRCSRSPSSSAPARSTTATDRNISSRPSP